MRKRGGKKLFRFSFFKLINVKVKKEIYEFFEGF